MAKNAPNVTISAGSLVQCADLAYWTNCAVGNVPASGPFTTLFEDDFSTGDISKHNDYFRWGGEGDIKPVGTLSNKVVDVTGPTGSTVKALEYNYGIFQEVRFHLTESVNQVIASADADTNVQYNEVWIEFDMFVPSNYTHRNTNGSSGATYNNKGFLSLWQDEYSVNAHCQGQIEWWPKPDGNSEMTLNVGGHKRNYDYVHPDYVSTEFNADAAAAFVLPSDRGQWRNYRFRMYAGSAHLAGDGVFEFYVDNELKARMIDINYQRNPSASDPLGFNKGYMLGYHNSGYADLTTFYITNFKFGVPA